MSDSFYNTITILILTVVPLTFLLLHTFLSTRKSILWSFPLPILWLAIGTWMVAVVYKDMGLSKELIAFFLIGEIILAAITILIKNINKKKQS